VNAFHSLEIFVNGECTPQEARPLTMPLSGPVLPTEWVCIVDGGARHVGIRDWNSENVFWIGDGDSVAEPHLQRLETSLKLKNKNLLIKKLPKEKSVSDLASALDHIATLPLSKNALCAHFYGCKGGRFDHEIITFLEILRWVQNRKQSTCVTFEHGIITNCAVSTNLQPGSVFSLLSPQKNAKLALEGALYSGTIELERPSHGLSNVALQQHVTVTPHKATVVLFWNLTAEAASK
jgi:thiamine pyrophosphokinase